MFGPTPDQVAAQAASILDKKPSARVIGIYTPGTWLGDADLQVGQDRLPVAFCTSSLQIRDALAEHGEDHSPLVLVTNVPEDQLGWDVTARLARRRLHHIDAWKIVRDRFRARDIDTRLTRYPWMANTLLQLPDHQITHVTNGFLDIDTAWQHLLRYTLGLDVRQPDAITLIHWSLEPDQVKRFDTLNDDCRMGLKQWVTQTGGAICATMIDAIASGYGEWLLPIGLACDVLYAADPQHDMELTQARTRLEPYLAGQTLPPAMAQAWRDAAKHVLRMQADTDALDWLDQAHRLLDELKAGNLSHLSSLLIAGFNQRLAQFGHALIEVINGQQDLSVLEKRLEVVGHHQQAVYQARRLDRARMAMRLARSLHPPSPRPLPTSLDQAVRDYATHHAYVDWARSVLLEGEEVAELALAYEQLSARMREQRETFNRQFATLLAHWHEHPQPLDTLIPIEQALPDIVARAASAAPILLVLIDGMSYAVFHELCADLKRRGWHALTHRPGASLPSLLSAIPSITQLSARALLRGCPLPWPQWFGKATLLGPRQPAGDEAWRPSPGVVSQSGAGRSWRYSAIRDGS